MKNKTRVGLNAIEQRRILRMEHPVDKLPVNPQCTEDCPITLDDLECALDQMTGEKYPAEAVLGWYEYVESELGISTGLTRILEEYDDEAMAGSCPEREEDAIAITWLLMSDLDLNLAGAPGQTADQTRCISQALAFLKAFKQNRNLPREDWVYPDFMMEQIIIDLDDDDALERADDYHLDRFRTFVETLAAADNIPALHARCQGHLTGNAAFGRDIKAAGEDALRLLKLTGDPQYAHILGCIYDEGPEGRPDHQEAFRYFSYGMANGYYDSMIRIADMYHFGLGTFKSEKTAVNLMTWLYDELRPRYEKGYGGEKLVEAAGRLGSMYLHGEGIVQNTQMAASYLLQADHALKTRMAERTSVGDQVLAEYLSSELELAMYQIGAKRRGIYRAYHFWPLACLLDNDYRIKWQARPLKNGQLSMRFTRLVKRNELRARKIFITIPEFRHCELTDSFSAHAYPGRPPASLQGRADAIELVYDPQLDDVCAILYEGDREVLRLAGDVLEMRI